MRSFKIRLTEGHARVVFERGARDLLGDDARAFIAAAEPLLSALRARGRGSIRAISTDFCKRVLRATFDVGGAIEVLRVDDPEFSEDLEPLCERARAAVAPPPPVE